MCVCVGMHVQFSKERQLHAGQLYEGQLHEETVLLKSLNKDSHLTASCA